MISTSEAQWLTKLCGFCFHFDSKCSYTGYCIRKAAFVFPIGKGIPTNQIITLDRLSSKQSILEVRRLIDSCRLSYDGHGYLTGDGTRVAWYRDRGDFEPRGNITVIEPPTAIVKPEKIKPEGYKTRKKGTTVNWRCRKCGGQFREWRGLNKHLNSIHKLRFIKKDFYEIVEVGGQFQ